VRNVDAAETGRRLQAARLLAQIERREDLAKKIDIAGLGSKTIGAIERGEREIKPHEFRPLAAALGVSVEFFAIDFNKLDEPPDENAPAWAQDIAENVDLILAHVRAGLPLAEEYESTEEAAA
jgi:transcriptional regulator with XRE-family HTH domain